MKSSLRLKIYEACFGRILPLHYFNAVAASLKTLVRIRRIRFITERPHSQTAIPSEYIRKLSK